MKKSNLFQKLKLKRLIALSLITALVVLGGAALILYPKLKAHYALAQQYDLDDLDKYNETSIFYDESDKEIGRLALENRIVLKHREIPDLMRQAIIAAEDRRFYWHYGVDVIGIARAIWVNLKTGKFIQGGSTITQQLAKNALGMFERSLDRKFVETFLALRIENHFTKEEILDYYINRIYFGKGYFGLEAAARGYFGKSAQQLTLGECAMLAGLIRSPNSASPRRNYQRALAGRDRVLQIMIDEKFITSQQAREAKQKRIRIVPETSVGLNKYFTPLILQEIQEALQLEEDEFPQGLRVYTTLNTPLQAAAERAVSETLTQVEWELGQEKNLRKTIENPGPLQAAVLVLDSAKGAVRAYVGGRDFSQSQFDRVTMAQRDNGASIYPFFYLLAMQHLGWHPASLIDSSFIDKPEIKTTQEITFGNPEQHLNKRFFILQEALSGNYKTAALRTAHQLGLTNVAQWLRNAGINIDENFSPKTFRDFQPLTLWEITSLYQILANQGRQKKPFFIRSIRDGKNKLLYSHQGSEGVAQVDKLTAQQMTLTLQQTLRDKALLQDISQPAAGMSCFSENQRDAWFLGYTPRWVTGVWVGYDPSVPIGNKTLAEKTATPLWQKIVQNLPNSSSNFTIPAALIKVEAEKNTGAVQGLAGFAPSPGNAFVYLKQSQLNRDAVASSRLSRVDQSDDWSSWLQTLFSNPSEFISSLPPYEEVDTSVIPAVAEYIMPPLRGDIVASDGSPLATTIQSQSLVLPWPSLETANSQEAALLWIKPKLERAAKWLEKPILFSDEELGTHYRLQRFHPVMISDLTPEQVAKFNQSELGEEGFVLQTYPKRLYPENHLLAHTLGYLQRTKATRIGPYQADLVIYDEYHGAEGLEKVFDAELSGNAGKFVIATTPEGFTQRTAIEKPATVGLHVRTTFDLELQKSVENSLTNIAAGAVVIMNVTNGDVVAMASQPMFDPNDFLPVLSSDKWQSFIHAEDNPLQHRAIRQFHPPGSVFKIMTTLASLQAGTFDPERIVYCKGYYQIGNVRFNLPKETYPVSFRNAFAQSINTYFIDLGLRTGRTALINVTTNFGVGQLTGITLPGELSGFMPTPDYIRKKYSRIMGAGDIANVSIGQGDLLVTPLQMANIMGAIANHGTLFRPRIVSEIYDSVGQTVTTFAPEILHHVTFPPEQFELVKEAMVTVTESGTGRRAQVNGIRVAGKTGTAQVGSKNKPRQIAWFAGFLPADKPRYAFAVMVEGSYEESLSGGSDAAVLIGEIFKDMGNG